MFDDVMPQEKTSAIGERIDFSKNLRKVFRNLSIKLDTQIRPHSPNLKDTIWLTLLAGDNF
ncbi:hypothetical protein JEU03_29985 [Pseudomonas aeruginosa]|nr:hypothetical protein [Pseudomonas aeruginosa]MBI7144491.1 hypothetical protein [Pseudomonas aeruginosa]HBP1198927.1 hypothetical protein [Pseudomonas aeruginosa]HCK3343711.1 hypothetical protein [Pseudomonas aeruginosa]HCK3356081.1 hypothetical protein [Pseudomonas aeruginosa]